jgi:hypothetical protein
MIVTNEPGCYFIEYIIDNALKDPTKAKYLNREKVSLGEIKSCLDRGIQDNRWCEIGR